MMSLCPSFNKQFRRILFQLTSDDGVSLNEVSPEFVPDNDRSESLLSAEQVDGLHGESENCESKDVDFGLPF